MTKIHDASPRSLRDAFAVGGFWIGMGIPCTMLVLGGVHQLLGSPPDSPLAPFAGHTGMAQPFSLATFLFLTVGGTIGGLAGLFVGFIVEQMIKRN